MSSVRVFMVEDYEPFRQFICSTVEKRPELEVIGSASDGLEAVQKAEDLQPDLILLDIGLPKLNGIEAARRIRKVSPDSKILFLSQESSADFVQEALNSGAQGYIVKAQAESELLAAVDAVLRGMQFVSRGLSGHNVADAGDAQVPDRLCHDEALPSLVPRKAGVTGGHTVQFYSDDALFLNGFTRFITDALKTEIRSPILVVTPYRTVPLRARQQYKTRLSRCFILLGFVPCSRTKSGQSRFGNSAACIPIA